MRSMMHRKFEESSSSKRQDYEAYMADLETLKNRTLEALKELYPFDPHINVEIAKRKADGRWP